MTPTTAFDKPWKDILEARFKEFTTFFLPRMSADIDWTREPVFLDKEMQAITPRGATGGRVVDKLVKVTLISGQEAHVLIHVEIQASPESDVAERMYVYNYRSFDRYHCRVSSVLVLLDDRPTRRPGSFGYEIWDTRVRIEYPVIKLSDCESRRAELETSRNPFATVVLAQLDVRRAGKGPAALLESKWSLARRLLEKGFTSDDVRALLRFIDAMISLPKPLEAEFWNRFKRHQEHARMRYVLSIERLARTEGLKKGRQEGRQKGRREGREEGKIEALRAAVLEFLEARFGSLPKTLTPALQAVADPERLKSLVRDAARAGSLAEIESKLTRPSAVRRARRSGTTSSRRR